MNSVSPDLTGVSPAAVPLTDIIEAYTRCLNISRDYLDHDLKETTDEDVDVERLDNFISVRADLIAAAEKSFKALAGCPADGDRTRQELNDRAISILEEMTEMENRLTTYLSDRLNNMRRIIGQMKKTEPVFKRYAHLGGKIHPSRITRHE